MLRLLLPKRGRRSKSLKVYKLQGRISISVFFQTDELGKYEQVSVYAPFGTNIDKQEELEEERWREEEEEGAHVHPVRIVRE